MDSTFSSLKLKLYLFYSINSYQRKDKKQLSVKYNKDGSSTGHPIYISGLAIERSSYSGKINPAEFCNILKQSKHF